MSTYEELLRALARKANLKRILIPLPFAAWWALAWTAELLPNPPVTRNQVELMQVDNVCSPGLVFIVTRLALCVQTIDTPESSFRKRQRGCLGHAATLRYPSPLIKPGGRFPAPEKYNSIARWPC